MKRIVRITAILLIFAFIFLVITACNQREIPESEMPAVVPESDVEPEPELPPFPTVNLSDHGALYDVYLRPFHTVSIFSTSWNDHTGIRPDQLAKVILVLTYTGDWTADDWNVSADEVESAAARYINVPADYLRTASTYRADSNTYALDGLGAPVAVRINEAIQQEDILTIDFSALSRADDTTVIWGSVVTIRLEQEGFTYLGCNFTPVEDLTYTGPIGDLLDTMEPAWLGAVALILVVPVYALRRRLGRAS